MRHYRKIKAAAGDNDTEVRRMLAEIGIYLLPYPKERLAPNETFSITTIKRVHTLYGTRLVTVGLQSLVATGKAGELRGDNIKAICEIVRAFPQWVTEDDRGGFVSALSKIDFDEIRERARFHNCKRWFAITMLLVERLTLMLGKGV